MGSSIINGKKNTREIREIYIKSNLYYVYDLDVDMYGKRRRLYAKTKEDLLKKLKQCKKDENFKKVSIISKIKTFCDLYQAFIENRPLTQIQRQVYINHIPFFEKHDIPLSEIDEGSFDGLLTEIARTRIEKNAWNIFQMITNTVEFGNYLAYTMPVPTKKRMEDLLAANIDFKSSYIFTLSDYAKLLEESRRLYSKKNEKRYYYEPTAIVLPILVETYLPLTTILNLTWKNIENRHIVINGKSYLISEQTLFTICDYNKSRYDIKSLSDTDLNALICDLPQNDPIIVSDTSSKRHLSKINEQIKKILYMTGYENKISTMDIAKQINQLF